MENKELKGKQVRMFLRNGYKYDGLCKGIQDNFLTLIDERTGMRIHFNLKEIQQVEVRA